MIKRIPSLTSLSSIVSAAKNQSSCAEDNDWKTLKEQQEASLERKVAEKDDKIAYLEEELSKLRSERAQEAIMARAEVKLLRQEKSFAESRLSRMIKDFDDRVAMEEYASLIKQTAPLIKENSTYVARLQAQLCKSLHNQTVLENQVNMASDKFARMAEKMKEDAAEILDEKGAMESEYRRRLKAAECENKALAKEYEAKLKGRNDILEDLVAASMSNFKTASKNGRDGPDVQRSIVEEVASIIRKLEGRQLVIEQNEKNLRQALQSNLVADLEGTVKVQDETIVKLKRELEEHKHREMKREAKKSHLRHATFSGRSSSLSTLTRNTSRRGNHRSSFTYAGPNSSW